MTHMSCAPSRKAYSRTVIDAATTKWTKFSSTKITIKLYAAKMCDKCASSSIGSYIFKYINYARARLIVISIKRDKKKKYVKYIY